MDSRNDPFLHLIQYGPTDKEETDRGMASAKQLLAPHVLILQMLGSRFQATRYRRPGLMLLIQRLVIISGRAHRYMRLVSSSIFSPFCVFTSCPLTVRIRLLVKPALHSCSFDLRPSAVRAWMHTVRVPCGIPYTLRHLLGSLFGHCEFPRILFRSFFDYDRYRWSYGASKIQIRTDMELLSFLS